MELETIVLAIILCAQCPLTVWIPHCMTRQQLAVREPIIKIEVEPGNWVEIPQSKDATVDGYKVSYGESDDIYRSS